MKNSLFLGVLILVVTMISLSGCASQPTFADQLAGESTEIANIGKQWNKGQELVEEGQENIDDGKKKIKKGEKQLKEGRKMVEKGRRLMQESEQSYQKSRLSTQEK